MLSQAEALDLIRETAPLLGDVEEHVGWPLAGRVLAHDVHAVVDLPPFATSAMDGYAVRSADLGDGPVPIAFRVAAGDRPCELPAGTASGGAAGAPPPARADALRPGGGASGRRGGPHFRPALMPSCRWRTRWSATVASSPSRRRRARGSAPPDRT